MDKMTDLKRRSASVAEIDLAALGTNLQRVKERIGSRKILAMVKANAYGHGAAAVSRFLAENGVAMLGVAYLEEGIALRKAGVRLPILLMTGCPIEQIPEIVHYRLIPVIF